MNDTTLTTSLKAFKNLELLDMRGEFPTKTEYFCSTLCEMVVVILTFMHPCHNVDCRQWHWPLRSRKPGP